MAKYPPKEALALSAAMTARGLKKAAIADQLGVTAGAVSQWASGHRPVPPDKASRLGDIVGLDPSELSVKYAEMKVHESNVVPVRNVSGDDERRHDLVIARLENDVDSLRYALGALVTVMTVHRPAEGAAVAKAIRKHVPAKFVKQGYVSELLAVLDRSSNG
jgi:transcriptional regulator with XRE-family HTH domain